MSGFLPKPKKGNHALQNSGCVVRACCAHGAAQGFGTVVTTSEDETSFGYVTGKKGPVMTLIVPEFSPRVAWHEAAHAVLGHAAGWSIEYVSVLVPQRVKFGKPAPNSWQRAVVSLAGAAGEDLRVSWLVTEAQANVEDYINRAHEFRGGNCDGCAAALCAWHLTGLHGERSKARELWRAAEAEAARICSLPNFREAISQLAARLTEHHRLDGTEADAIISRHVEFGQWPGETSNV